MHFVIVIPFAPTAWKVLCIWAVQLVLTGFSAEDMVQHVSESMMFTTFGTHPVPKKSGNPQKGCQVVNSESHS